MVRRLLTMAAALTVLLAATGCGGDDDGGGGGEALTEAEFLEQGNQICIDAEEEIASQEPQTENPSPEEIEEYLDDVVIPTVEQQVEDIGDLNAPEELQDEVDELLAEAEAALAEIGDLSGEEIMAVEDDPFAEVNAMAEELGLTECD